MDEVTKAVQRMDAENMPSDESGHFICKCKHNDGVPCSTLFCRDLLMETRLQYIDLSSTEKDIAILAKIACGAHMSADTENRRVPRPSGRETALTSTTTAS